jgi:hypothetical protein
MKTMKKIIYLILFFSICSHLSYCQIIHPCYTISLNDSSTNFINKYYFKLLKEGFLAPSLTLIKSEDKTQLEICPGNQYKFITLEIEKKKFSKYKPNEIENIISNKFNDLLNNGFPFASVKIDSIVITNQSILGELMIIPGPYFEWGELIVQGNSTINEQILRGIIDIKKNTPYKEESYQNIENKLNQLSYITSFKRPEILFENGKVNLYLYLNSKPVSNISGTVGLQQNPQNQHYFLIGDFRLKLTNQLKRSENIDFQWRRIQEGTQNLKISGNYPSLFKSNFGLDDQFTLYKKDSTFIELKNQLSLQYFSSSGILIRANYKYLESSIISTSLNSKILGKSVNYFYGLSFLKQKVDYQPAPRKGFQIIADFSIGKRSTSRTDTLKEKYDNTLKCEYSFTKYTSIFKRHILKLQFSGDIYIAPYYYQNEMIRFGGLINQRGFREDELLSNIRLTQSFEYRFMIDQNSYLFTFYDFSYYENHLTKTIYDTPYGFGSGISFGTTQGIFSISYAIGKQLTNPLLLKNGIIHFGYISYF